MGGDFEEKRRGKTRLVSSFNMFNSFIHDMDMAEISSVRYVYTWVNNQEGEEFVEEKLDRFFGAFRWLSKYPRSQVINVEKQTSDHSLLVLTTEPAVPKHKKRFCFDQRWLQWRDSNEVVEKIWNKGQEGSRVYHVCSRIKNCRIELLK